MLWTNSIGNNISALPEQLAGYDRLICENKMSYALDSYYDESAIIPYYKPRVYLQDCTMDLNNYTAMLLLPLALNGVNINVQMFACEERLGDSYDCGIDFYWRDYRQEGELNEGLTDIIGAPTYVADKYKLYIRLDDRQQYKYVIHKAIACLYNVMSMDGVSLGVYPIPDKLYTELFNYRIDKFLKLYKEWLDTFYHDALSTYTQRARDNAVRAIIRTSANSYKAELDNIIDCIHRHERDLENLYSRLQTAQYLYNGAMYNATDERINEITQLFSQCENLRDVHSRGHKVYLRFVAPLINYDLDLARQWCENDCNPFSERGIQDLMYRLLVNGKYTLLLEAEVMWDVGSIAIGNHNEANIVEACPQPHLVYYNCFGDNKTMILNALSSQDYGLALDCTNAAISSINIIDHPVLNRWLDWLTNAHNYNKLCVYNNETGELVSLKEVMEDDSITRTTA